jgi:hypothetical protein
MPAARRMRLDAAGLLREPEPEPVLREGPVGTESPEHLRQLVRPPATSRAALAGGEAYRPAAAPRQLVRALEGTAIEKEHALHVLSADPLHRQGFKRRLAGTVRCDRYR